MDDISRDVYEGVGPDGIDLRLYEHNGRKHASVTTILKTRDEDTSHLDDWKDRNDGKGDNADHEHLFWYSRHLGTLGHWHALHELDDDLGWSPDEEQSARELRRRYEDEVESDSPREILYSIMRGDSGKYGGRVSSWGDFYDTFKPYQSHDYYGTNIFLEAMNDVAFFRDGQQNLWDTIGITRDDVIAVEQYLFDDTYGYAGQVDLVYEDPEGYTVVADLKSSSGCYDKHQLQGAAYARAIENSDDVPLVTSVDRIEVHRVHPRTGQMAVHTHKNAPGLKPYHTTKYWNQGIDDCFDEFSALIGNFKGDYDDYETQ